MHTAQDRSEILLLDGSHGGRRKPPFSSSQSRQPFHYLQMRRRRVAQHSSTKNFTGHDYSSRTWQSVSAIGKAFLLFYTATLADRRGLGLAGWLPTIVYRAVDDASNIYIIFKKKNGKINFESNKIGNQHAKKVDKNVIELETARGVTWHTNARKKKKKKKKSTPPPILAPPNVCTCIRKWRPTTVACARLDMIAPTRT